MITKPDILNKPIAEDGDKVMPSSVASTTVASIPLGYPTLQSTPLLAGGTQVKRDETNGLFYRVSHHTVYVNAGGQYTFDTEIVKVGGYPKDTILFNPDTGRFVKSLIDNNTDNFLTNPNKINNISWADFQVTLLGNNVDTHTLTVPGIYFQNNPAYATTALHYPINGFTGVIYVSSVNDGLGSLTISQMAILVDNEIQTTNTIYNCSNYSGNGFSGWYQQVNTQTLENSSLNAFFNTLKSKGSVQLSIGNGLKSGLIVSSNPNNIPDSAYLGMDGAGGGAGGFNGIDFFAACARPRIHSSSILGNTADSLAKLGDITANGVGIVDTGVYNLDIGDVVGKIYWAKYAPDVYGNEFISQWARLRVPNGVSQFMLPIPFKPNGSWTVVGSLNIISSTSTPQLFSISAPVFATSAVQVQILNGWDNDNGVYFIAQGY